MALTAALYKFALMHDPANAYFVLLSHNHIPLVPFREYYA